ncbi:MAG TPA: sulfite exporter TauE/SafE family protein, partial [Alphaproteobacteria bacterium]|nr:sulfite exporter TauE/SafE family protein [Alphaproteobacteria bacterium]
LSGFAFGLVALGLWLHLVEPAVAGPLVVLGSLTGQLITTIALRRSFRPDLFWPFILGGAFGVPLGVMVLKFADPGPLKRGFGIFLVAYAAYALLRPPLRPVLAGGRVADGGIGMVGGIMGGIAGLSGAIPVLWCDLRGWGKEIGRGVYQPFNIAMHALALSGMAIAGLLTAPVWTAFAVCLPGVVVGTLAGLKLYEQVDERQFRTIVLWLVLASGVVLTI